MLYYLIDRLLFLIDRRVYEKDWRVYEKDRRVCEKDRRVCERQPVVEFSCDCVVYLEAMLPPPPVGVLFGWHINYRQDISHLERDTDKDIIH